MEKCFSSTKSEDYRVRGFDSYDLSGESFTHDNPVEVNFCYCSSFMDFLEVS